MKYVYDITSLEQVLASDLDSKLRQLLASRAEIVAAGHTEYLLVQPGDTEADIVRHVGFSPMVEPIDGARFPDAGFHPHWDWLADHDGAFELIESFGSSFAYVLLIQDADSVLPELLALCQRYSGDRA